MRDLDEGQDADYSDPSRIEERFSAGGQLTPGGTQVVPLYLSCPRVEYLLHFYFYRYCIAAKFKPFSSYFLLLHWDINITKKILHSTYI
jgi:hypothetical protein